MFYLGKYITKKGERPVVDYEVLSEDIGTAVRFLDDAIDVNKYPLPEIEAMHKGNRKIGLGVMGWTDMLIKLGIPYGSKSSFLLAQELMKFFRDRARQYSAILADKRGVEFQSLCLRRSGYAGRTECYHNDDCSNRHTVDHCGLFKRDRTLIRPCLQKVDYGYGPDGRGRESNWPRKKSDKAPSREA